MNEYSPFESVTSDATAAPERFIVHPEREGSLSSQTPSPFKSLNLCPDTETFLKFTKN